MHTPELMRRQNRAIILAAIQEQGLISRVDLASLLGLNPATVTRITRDLIDDGLVKEEGEGATKGAGRKPILLRFNHSARLVIAVQGEGKQILTGALADLAGNVLHRRAALSPEASAGRLIEELLEENPSYRQRLAAICLCLPPQDAEPIYGLEQKYGVPVIASDVVTAATIGEAVGNTGSSSPTESAFVVLYLGANSANCLYLNGQTLLGQLGYSHGGESLNTILSDSGLVAAFRAIRAEGFPSAVTQPERASLIFEAVRHGDPAATFAVDRIVRDLAYCAAWISRAFGVRQIVIAGGWVRAADVLLPRLQKQLAAWNVPEISIAKQKDEASLMGALQMAIRIANPTK